MKFFDENLYLLDNYYYAVIGNEENPISSRIFKVLDNFNFVGTYVVSSKKVK